MKKILLIIILPLLTLAQTNIRVKGELVTIKNNEGIIILNEYIDSCRIETAQTVNRYTKLNQVSLQNIPPLPQVGGLCEKNKIYAYDTTVVLCLQTHARTIFDPRDTPNLFAIYREGTNLEWTVNEYVAKDDIRWYQGARYKCLMSHTCLLTWTPVATLGILWKLDTGATCPAWIQPTGAHDAYKIGDCVIYLGKCYESLINGNVWSPTVYPQGWKEIPCP